MECASALNIALLVVFWTSFGIFLGWYLCEYHFQKQINKALREELDKLKE